MVSSSIRSTRPRSAGCQPDTASTMLRVHLARGLLGPVGRRRDRRAGADAAAQHHVRLDGVDAHAGRELGRRLLGRAARVHRAHGERDAGGRVDRDHEAAEQDLRQRVVDLGRQRRAGEDAEAADAGVDHLDVGQQRAPDRGVDAVGADQHVALGGAAVGEQQADAVAVALEAGDGAGAQGVAEPGAEDLAQRAAVDRGVRALAVVGRAEVRGGRELVGLRVDHDRHALRRRVAGRLQVELVEVLGQAGLERVAAVAVDGDAVALAPDLGVALVDGARDAGALAGPGRGTARSGRRRR